MRSLFVEDNQPAPQAARLAPKLKALAAEGIFLGTSSWKYPGWLGSIYSESRYLTRKRFSKAKFEAECLQEYAETFCAVGGDFSFYRFPTVDFWADLFGSSPRSLVFGLKVPDQITVNVWPTHQRYGQHAGQINEHFLDAGLYFDGFARPLEKHRERVATIIFEFGTFSALAFRDPSEFFARLDAFLGMLPPGFKYAVETRNAEFLGPAYFDVLRSHNVAHVFNAWTRAPEIGEQMAMPGAFTADFVVSRALLRKGRTYEQAVQRFEPYRSIQEPQPLIRDALRKLIDRGRERRAETYVFINNRMEGNAPGTIEAILEGLDVESGVLA